MAISEFLRYAQNRSGSSDAENIVVRLKEIAASWDQEADDISDEEAFKILLEKTWISLQGSSKKEAICDITPLADFIKLTGLCLWDNAIASIAPLQNLTELVRLGLRGNRVQDLAPLEKMARLQELEIQSNPVRDFSVLARLPSLRDLEIDSSQIAAFANTREFPGLWRLTVNGKCEDLRGLPELPNLRYLRMDGCKSLDGIERFAELRNLYTSSGEIRDLAPLGSLKKLTHLYIGHNRIESLEPVRRLYALREIRAGYNRIKSVEPLQGLPALHEVDLSENPVSPQEVQRLELELTS